MATKATTPKKKKATKPTPKPTAAAPKPPAPELLNAEILGVTELADFLGVKATTVHVWGTRGHRPPADLTVNGHEAWHRLTIVKWAAETGRLPVWLEAEGAEYVPEGGYKRPRRTKAEMSAA